MKIQNAIPNKFENLQHYYAKQDNEFFDGECFQQIFGVIIGANVVPIFANLYMTQLENIFKEKHKNDKKKKNLPVLFTRCIVDGFGITKGSKIDFNY